MKDDRLGLRDLVLELDGLKAIVHRRGDRLITLERQQRALEDEFQNLMERLVSLEATVRGQS